MPSPSTAPASVKGTMSSGKGALTSAKACCLGTFHSPRSRSGAWCVVHGMSAPQCSSGHPPRDLVSFLVEYRDTDHSLSHTWAIWGKKVG